MLQIPPDSESLLITVITMTSIGSDVFKKYNVILKFMLKVILL